MDTSYGSAEALFVKCSGRWASLSVCWFSIFKFAETGSRSWPCRADVGCSLVYRQSPSSMYRYPVAMSILSVDECYKTSRDELIECCMLHTQYQWVVSPIVLSAGSDFNSAGKMVDWKIGRLIHWWIISLTAANKFVHLRDDRRLWIRMVLRILVADSDKIHSDLGEG